jgi:hypothetical protein
MIELQTVWKAVAQLINGCRMSDGPMPNTDDLPSTMPKMRNSKHDKPNWHTSEAKRLLEHDLISGNIPLHSDGSMEPKEVYLQRPEFAEFSYEYFRDRLRVIRKQINEKLSLASFDNKALSSDRIKHPKSTHNSRGEPRWDGSISEQLLKIDMKEGRHKSMKPLDLYQSRPEYCNNYSLSVFRKHIDQEVRHQKTCAVREQKKKPAKP